MPQRRGGGWWLGTSPWFWEQAGALSEAAVPCPCEGSQARALQEMVSSSQPLNQLRRSSPPGDGRHGFSGMGTSGEQGAVCIAGALTHVLLVLEIWLWVPACSETSLCQRLAQAERWHDPSSETMFL